MSHELLFLKFFSKEIFFKNLLNGHEINQIVQNAYYKLQELNVCLWLFGKEKLGEGYIYLACNGAINCSF